MDNLQLTAREHYSAAVVASLRRFSAVNMLSLNVILVPDFINIK
jgi:hypothetical protein